MDYRKPFSDYFETMNIVKLLGMNTGKLLFTGILLSVLICHATLCTAGSMKDLGTLGGNSSWGYGINDAGEVVGNSEITGHTTTHGFLYSGGVMTDIGTFSGGTFSEAHGINNAGDIVGWGDFPPYMYMRGFLYSGGVMKDLGALGGNTSRAYAINDAGQITGYAANNKRYTHAFIYSGGVMADLGNLVPGHPSYESYGMSINNHGEVAGYAVTSNGHMHAFLYSGGGMMDLGTLGGGISEAFGINDAGEVVGWSDTSGGQTHAFLYSGGVMHDLGTFSGSTYDVSHAYSINYEGQVVGDSTGPSHAFLYTGGVMTDLGSLGRVVDSSGAYAINSAGQVVGFSYGNFTYGPHAFLYSPDTYPHVHVVGRGYYDHLQDAYSNAPLTCTILAQSGELTGDLTADLSKSVTLKGGYDGKFLSNPGLTAIIGIMTISSGSVAVENVIIR